MNKPSLAVAINYADGLPDDEIVPALIGAAAELEATIERGSTGEQVALLAAIIVLAQRVLKNMPDIG